MRVKRLKFRRNEILDLLCRVWSGELTVGKNGVKFRGIWYGKYDPELLALQGKKVRVSYDPDDLAEVDVYEAATWRYIASAAESKLIAYGRNVSDEDLREGMKQSRRAKRAAKEYADTARIEQMDLTDLAIAAQRPTDEPPTPPSSEPAILRPAGTAMAGQLQIHRKLRQAAGAEVEPLEFDFSQLKNQRDAIEKWLDD